jgi:hypothetical protein
MVLPSAIGVALKLEEIEHGAVPAADAEGDSSNAIATKVDVHKQTIFEIDEIIRVSPFEM